MKVILMGGVNIEKEVGDTVALMMLEIAIVIILFYTKLNLHHIFKQIHAT